LLIPDQVWTGVDAVPHAGWVVLVSGNRIQSVGPRDQVKAPAGTVTINLPGTTLIPGMIEAHSHMFLHPYNETSWNDQVLKEPLALRTARAVNHVRATLMAGFTSSRDLGTEGAGFADVGLKQAINEGIIPGPRMFVATRAVVAVGAYGPKGFDPRWDVPQGAEEAAGLDDITRVVREQMGKGADWVKLYGDYRWGVAGQAMPTFTEEEMAKAVEVAHSAGRPVAVTAAAGLPGRVRIPGGNLVVVGRPGIGHLGEAYRHQIGQWPPRSRSRSRRRNGELARARLPGGVRRARARRLRGLGGR